MLITDIRGLSTVCRTVDTGHENFHVRGYKEEGTTTTPFDMTVLNDLDRFHLASDVVDRVPKLERIGAHFQQWVRNKLVEHKHYITGTWRRHARDQELEVALLADENPRTELRVEQSEERALRCRRQLCRPHPPSPLWEGKIEWNGNDARFQVRTSARNLTEGCDYSSVARRSR